MSATDQHGGGAGELAGRAALVTGGAKGIGAATAAVLTRLGARVAVVDVDVDVDATGGTRAPEGGIAVRADVSQAADVERAVDDAVDAFGRLDIVVNSAGIQRYGDAVDTGEDVWDEVLGVNLKSIFLTAKYGVPHLRAAGGGAIVTVASVQALAAQKGVAAYAASKGGAVALTTAMAVDFAPDVRVNCVCPGSVDTPMLRDAAELFVPDDPDGAVRSWGAMHPLGRVASPEEVAEVIAFLAGPRSSFVTGAALRVDGGLLSQIGGT